MGKLNIEIKEELHDLMRHKRIETKQSNDEIIEEALTQYFNNF